MCYGRSSLAIIIYILAWYSGNFHGTFIMTNVRFSQYLIACCLYLINSSRYEISNVNCVWIGEVWHVKSILKPDINLTHSSIGYWSIVLEKKWRTLWSQNIHHTDFPKILYFLFYCQLTLLLAWKVEFFSDFTSYFKTFSVIRHV